MISFDNIKEYVLSKPSGRSVFGSIDDFAQMPTQHQEQTHFLNREANTYLYQYISDNNLITGPIWNPFSKGNFRKVEEFTNLDDEQELKKWLYRRSVPFKNWVFLLPSFSEDPIYLTWKMVIKYSYEIFWGIEDIVIFDQTQNWCLFYFHEEHLFFGRENTFDPEIGYQAMQSLYEKKEKFPGFKHPLIPD
jgi:hypothetical protein